MKCLYFNIFAILLVFKIALGDTSTSINRYHLVDGAKPNRIEKTAKLDSTKFIYKEYTVITFSTTREVGENIVVYKNDINYKHSEYYYNFGHQSAGYFFGLAGNYLFIDRGTGPGMRGLEVFDLKKKAITLNDEYQDPIRFSNDTLIYWTRDSVLATEKNCKDLMEWEKDGLGGAIQYFKKIVLRKNKTIYTGKKRCAFTQ